jgi:hypothetical protein
MNYIFGIGSLIEQASRYPRRAPFAIPLAQDIDTLLKKHLPTYFAEIRLAPGPW